MGQRRNFSKEFKLEAVNLVVTRGVSVAQACRDLDVSENVMKRWIREFHSSEGQAFPGHEVQKPNDAELTRLRREVAKLKMERDILKKASTSPYATARGSCRRESSPRWAAPETVTTTAMAETINGLYKTEVVRKKGPWKTVEALEWETLNWVHWFNQQRLLGPIGHIPPAEFEALYKRSQQECSAVA